MTELLVLGDRRFPSVALVCPPDDVERTRWDRSLGASPGDKQRYVPAENGVIFAVEPFVGVDPAGEGAAEVRWDLHMLAPSCYVSRDESPGGGDWIWLPHYVSLLEGKLIAEQQDTRPKQGVWTWEQCEAWWIVEQIDRVSRMEFTIPDGPRVQLADRLTLIAEHEREKERTR